MITVPDRWRHAPRFAVRYALLIAEPAERCGIRTHTIKPCAHRREFASGNFLIACGYKDGIEPGILLRVHLLSPHLEPGTAFYRPAPPRHQAGLPGATHGVGRGQFTREDEGFNKRAYPEQFAAVKQNDGDAAQLWLAAPVNRCISFETEYLQWLRWHVTPQSAHLFNQFLNSFQTCQTPKLLKPNPIGELPS